jgi:predicted permease
MRNLWKQKQVEGELDAELRAYVEAVTEEKVAAGLGVVEARRMAQAEFGGLEQVKQGVRETRGGAGIERWRQDLGYGLRQLRRNPGFAAVAIATLAVGIGATTAIASLVDCVLLRPLPFARQDELVRISGWYPKGWVRAVAEQTRTLDGVMSFSLPMEHNVTPIAGGSDIEAAPVEAGVDIHAAGSPERVFASQISTNGFDVLGVRPVLGRNFIEREAVAGQDHAVLLSYGYWQERCGADPAVLGRTLRIEGVAYSVIGVMPRGLNFPNAETQMWLPVAFQSGDPIDAWAMFTGSMIGRMRPGRTPAAVQAEMRALHPGLLKRFPWPMPEGWYVDVTATPLLTSLVGNARPRLLILLAAVAMLLVTACSNVASLMMERATAREGEFALRGALGASSRRLIRQMLTESLLLGLIAAGVGVALAEVAMPALRAILPADLPRLAEVRIDAPVLGFTVLLATGASLIFGLAPALRLRSQDLRKALQASRGRSSAGRLRVRATTWIVVLQMALTVVTVTVSGVLLHSLWRLVHVDPGFATANILTAEVSLDGKECSDPAQQQRCAGFFSALIDGLKSQPGVEDAAVVSMLPMAGEDDGWAYDAEGHPRAGTQTPDQGAARMVSPGYFRLMGIPLLQGRLLRDEDGGGKLPVIVISRRMADRLWPGGDAVGKRLEFVGQEKRQGVLDENARTVVGVVGTTHHASLGSPVTDEMYAPMAPPFVQANERVVVRTTARASEAAATLRRVVRSLNRGAPVSRVAWMSAVVAESAATERSLAVLCSAFALLIAGLGAVGVYGLTVSVVAGRRQELGIRMALGATRSSVAGMVLRHGLVCALAGGGIGIAAAVAAVRLLRSQLYATEPLDPVVLGAVPGLLLALTLGACLVPAWRAAHIQPGAALRDE